jgi:hypothetical protein
MTTTLGEPKLSNFSDPEPQISLAALAIQYFGSPRNAYEKIVDLNSLTSQLSAH